eukprot:Gb_06775 [translate_table: standard]
MDISQGLSEVIMVEVGDSHFVQNLDYKNTSFRCTLCKSHGHQKITYPYNKQINFSDASHMVMSPSNLGVESLAQTRKGKWRMEDESHSEDATPMAQTHVDIKIIEMKDTGIKLDGSIAHYWRYKMKKLERLSRYLHNKSVESVVGNSGGLDLGWDSSLIIQNKNLSLMEPVTMEELHKVIKSIQQGKPPGPDRWMIEFFTGFEDMLAPDLLAIVEESKEADNYYRLKDWLWLFDKLKKRIGHWSHKWISRAGRYLAPHLKMRSMETAPLFSVDDDDMLVWAQNPNGGTYSVKLDYKALSGQNEEDEKPWWWSGIWKFWAPPKAKLFVWLALHNQILTWDNLLKRGKEGLGICFLCRESVEYVLHILVKCHFSKEVWSAVGSLGRCLVWDGNSLEEAWNTWFKSHDTPSEMITLPLHVMWGMWITRNEDIFKYKRPTPMETLYKIKYL